MFGFDKDVLKELCDSYIRKPKIYLSLMSSIISHILSIAYK
jgi:hypothetical protein